MQDGRDNAMNASLPLLELLCPPVDASALVGRAPIRGGLTGLSAATRPRAHPSADLQAPPAGRGMEEEGKRRASLGSSCDGSFPTCCKLSSPGASCVCITPTVQVGAPQISAPSLSTHLGNGYGGRGGAGGGGTASRLRRAAPPCWLPPPRFAASAGHPPASHPILIPSSTRRARDLDRGSPPTCTPPSSRPFPPRPRLPAPSRWLALQPARLS